MIVFKLNGQTINIPTRWADVTFSQYVQLLSVPDGYVGPLSVFTGIPVSTLVKAEIKNLDKFIKAISFLKTPYPFDKPSRTIGSFSMPKKIEYESLGQFEDLVSINKRLVEQLKDPDERQKSIFMADACLKAVAIYYMKARFNQYDTELMEETCRILADESCVEIIGTGAFFLRKPADLQRPTTNVFQNIFRRWRRTKQESPNSPKISGF